MVLKKNDNKRPDAPHPDAEVKYPPQGYAVCRYESFSHTGKRKASLCDLCGLERPEGVGVRKKPLKALSLARFARARRVRREKRDMPVSKIMRKLNFVHTSCPCQGRSKYPPQGYAGLPV